MEQDNQSNNEPIKSEKRSQRREEKLQAREAQKRKRKNQRLMTWGLALIILVAAGYGIFKFSASSENQGGTIAATDAISEQDHVKGSRDARVTIVEYSDFQCPACAQYYPIVKALADEFDQQIAIVYRHFPLITIHPFADLAARSTEAAAAQGKFWEMHDMLFENQTEWTSSSPRDTIRGYAESLGLDVVQFEADLESDAVKDKVRGDLLSGQRARVNATPTFFVNGEKLETNPRSYNEFAELIRLELGPEANQIEETGDAMLEQSDE